MDNKLLTLRGVTVTPVNVPMKRPLVTSVQTIVSAPMLLIDVQTQEGVTGHAYVFCYLQRLAVAVKAACDEIAEAVTGERLAPRHLAAQLKRHFRLVGATGVVNTALAGFDMACWDAMARATGSPLVELLGGRRRPIRAYNSCGLGMSAPETLAAEALELLEGGFKAVKIRLGRADLEADLRAVRTVRRVLPADVVLMADYNQALGRAEALQRCRALDDEGLYWIEEPIRHDDYPGCAALAASVATPIQIGENFVGPQAMALALAANACDYCMPDVERIGGVTGWMDAAALAAVSGTPMSSHLMPEISAHLLAASASCHWLEYVDWADAILQEPLQVVDGHVQMPDRPGSGIDWDAKAVRRLRIE
ncbi:enolase C-terminal domain-like protein [Variovorax sp. Sphag1AA]|uniref:enolase C-terminal domain-like protein n=1 Tax=Variovorax sp. Sphag1AA TaxID=2587027 RepID=UPI00161BA138|nr:enolase C-terminal domain-like protein [Variovorax sp. Sphag1AA]MBB3178737.1 mandelate racemase [Variovorax sp. Sphag1AA]